MTRMVKDQGGLTQVNDKDFHTCMFACFLFQENPKRVHQALKDPSWIEAMQEELLQFKIKKEEGIDYEKVFAPVARIEAIRLFLAYASFMGFMVYQMDVKSAFLYGTIEEEVYICQPLRFEDLNYPDKVYKVVKALYGLHQAPRAWYETLANYLLENGSLRGKIDQTLFIKKQKGLQVKQKDNGIFISQDKYVAEILRKFGLTDGKSASTPIDTEKPLLKDLDKEDTIVATSSTEAEYVAAVSYCAQVLWIQNQLLDYGLIITNVSSKLMLFGLTIDVAHLMLLGHKTSVSIKKSNDVMRLQALIDRKKVIITEDTIRQSLRLDDAAGVDCLPNEEIFAELARMGYEKPSTKLTFYKAFFSTQWKFLIYIILQCMSAKRTAWNEFSSSMALTVICLATGRKFNFSKYIFDIMVRNLDSPSKFLMYLRFLQLMINAQVNDLSAHNTKYTSPAPTQKVFANMRRIGKGFSGVDTPLFDGMLVQQQVQAIKDVAEDEDDDNETCATLTKQVTNLEQDKIAQAIEITKLKQRARRLEKKRQFKSLGLKRLKKVRTAQRVESLADTVMDDQEDASKHRGKITELDVDKDVTLEDVDAEVAMDADVQGRLSKSQAKVYHLGLQHAEKVLSMQDTDEAEPDEASAPRRRRGVVIQDPEETGTALVSVHSKGKSKDKGKGILIEEPKPLKRQAQIKQDEAFARELEVELNANINWNDVLEQVKRKEKQDNTVMRYRALKRKHVTEAHARKNIMVYLKNMAGFKMDFFKGMTYNDIRPIFEKHYNLNQAFLERVEEDVIGQREKGNKRKGNSLNQDAAKKKRIDEETEELKTLLHIIANDDDDVYTEVTPLALKVPVLDYQIHHEHNKPYYKIIRADGTHQLFLSFITLLKNFDREDLEML
nr:hypothetical protein [Tanacetum cinerariifolium]